MSTRVVILDALRRDPLTIAELCKKIGVTRNAVNIQIKQLEADGLIRPYVSNHQGKVGKPAISYEAAPGSEDISSKGYRIFLSNILGVLKSQYGEEQLLTILEETGRSMARSANLDKPVSFDDGLRNAMLAADSIGASTEAIQQDDGIMVRNYSCPMGSTVRDEPCVCRAISAFFSEATNSDVTEKCIRNDRLICQYLINQKTYSNS